MANHPKNVTGFKGSLEELAKQVGNMTYDQTSTFIEKLADDLIKQAKADSEKGRIKLSTKLYETANKLYEAKDSMNTTWNICKPYMK